MKRWKKAAAVRRKLGLGKKAFYTSLVKTGKICTQAGLTERAMEACTGYYDDEGKIVNCMEKRPIDCRGCAV